MKLLSLAKKLPLCFAIAFANQLPAQNTEEISTADQLVAAGGDELPPFDDYLPEPPPQTVPEQIPTTSSPSTPSQELPVVETNIEENSGAFQLTDAGLNDVFGLLAENANRQYFHNPRISGPDFNVTGRLLVGDPLGKMEELAFQYGLEIYQKGNTVYALTKEQMGELPSKEFHYRLRYLRPSDIEAIRVLVAPYLSPGTGIVNFEPKTNTVVVIDTPQRIERVENFFKKIDEPLGQVVIEVKILSVNSTAASNIGVNWSQTLGDIGLSLDAIYNLNSIFGIDAGALPADNGTSNFVLDSASLSGVLRALNEGGLVKQMSNPVVITEDNEQAIISLIDRVPIITRTITNSDSGVQNTSEEVRYVLDSSDPVGDPATTREIGITMAVTPQILGDGTIRLQMRPRSAQIVGEVEGVDGNVFPQVSESTIQTLARIPDGHSLIVGGFFSESESDGNTKVPLLGDIPLLNFIFKSKAREKQSASLIFVVTPTSYSPEDAVASHRESHRLEKNLSLRGGHDSINPHAPGRAHDANYCRTLQAINHDLGRSPKKK